MIKRKVLHSMINLDPAISDEIIKCCQKYNVTEIILFGSRARGDNNSHSDIDLAIKGSSDFDRLFADLKYNEFTLLDMDIINLDSYLSESLMNDILQDGYILYQKGPDNESKN